SHATLKIEQFIGFFGDRPDGANQLGWGVYDLRVATLERIFRATQNRAGCCLDAQERWSFRVLLSHDDAASRRPEQLCAQLVEQRLRVLQIGGVEALGEPVVDVCDHRHPANNSRSAASMNSSSGGFTPKAAPCPQMEGIGRSSAFGIWATSSSL